jgi:hypothetical protein
MTDAILKMRITSVTQEDPSMRMMPGPFAQNRIYLSVMREEKSLQKDTSSNPAQREMERPIGPQMMRQRNPLVIPISMEEYEGLGRPTVGDVLDVIIKQRTTES